MQRTKVSKLLDFIFPISNLSEIITPKTRGLLDQRIDTLEELSRNLGEGKPIEGKTASLIYNKFNRYFDGISDEKFERGEFRILSSILDYAPSTEHKSILASSEKLKFALALLDANWRDSYLPGLIRTFLKSWKSVPIQSLQKLEELINLKASKYKGKQSTINVFKANKKYFNTKDGDIKLGKYLAAQKKSILSVTKMLSIPDEWFKYYYFSSVIITYFENLKKDSFVEFIENDLDEILRIHHFSLTKQVLVSRIIIRTNNDPEFEDLHSFIRKIAFKYVGDPEVDAKWIPEVGATEQDKEDIETARKILNDWISQQFIQVFFEKCINEPRRKKFWKEVAEKNSMSFRIIGSQDTKRMLKSIEKISPFVDSRFNITEKDSDESAIVMDINDYMLIEFSDENKAFYAYKKNSPHEPKITKTTKLDSIRDLINGSMPFILKAGYIENDEGRLVHKDGKVDWERNFTVVLKKLVKIK